MLIDKLRKEGKKVGLLKIKIFRPFPYEAALMDNHPVVDPERPVEVLRTVHSFDPCLACAVHLYDEEKKKRIFVQAKTVSK
ncbi:MAG TPA: hypothetical protein EYP03_03860 [Aquificae bacterium]|nr:hypothetical protein [Aquificota bacterium]